MIRSSRIVAINAMVLIPLVATLAWVLTQQAEDEEAFTAVYNTMTFVDGRLRQGPWGYFRPECYSVLGVGFGIGWVKNAAGKFALAKLTQTYFVISARDGDGNWYLAAENDCWVWASHRDEGNRYDTHGAAQAALDALPPEYHLRAGSGLTPYVKAIRCRKPGVNPSLAAVSGGSFIGFLTF
jgi:hypothetical protein